MLEGDVDATGAGVDVVVGEGDARDVKSPNNADAALLAIDVAPLLPATCEVPFTAEFSPCASHMLVLGFHLVAEEQQASFMHPAAAPDDSLFL